MMSTDAELNEYERGLRQLLEVCERKNIVVEFVDGELLRDYAGMNSKAAKTMGFEWPRELGKEPNGDWILVSKALHDRGKYETLQHEIIELGLMNDGVEYFPAHKIALEKEHRLPRKLLKMRKRERVTAPSLVGVRL